MGPGASPSLDCRCYLLAEGSKLRQVNGKRGEIRIPEGRRKAEIRNPRTDQAGIRFKFRFVLLKSKAKWLQFLHQGNKGNEGSTVSKETRINSCLSSLPSFPSVQGGCILWFWPPRLGFRTS